MFGKNVVRVAIILGGFFLVACSPTKSHYPETHDVVASFDEVDGRETENTTEDLDEENLKIVISELSQDSKFIPYPEKMEITPFMLSDTKMILAQARVENRLSLGYIDMDTQEFVTLKKIEDAPEELYFVVHDYRDNHLIFEEYHRNESLSKYYDWNMEDKTEHLICEIPNIPNIHYTQTDYKKDLFAMNLYNPDSQYYSTYFYSTKDHSLSMVEEKNSSHPVFCKGKLYYILIDNQEGKTSLIEYGEEDKRVLERIEDRSRFLFGLYSNGESLLKLIYNNDGVEFYRLNDRFEANKIYQTEFAESVTYRKNWISFLGKQRTEERGRLQYYLIDDEGKIDYPYDDGSIFMSNAGILWVDFKKAEDEIQKGKVFTNENSVLRFFAFDGE